jgi:hypothetical protein
MLNNRKHYLKYIDYYTQYNVLNRDRIRKRNQKKKEHIKKIKRKWYLKNKRNVENDSRGILF